MSIRLPRDKKQRNAVILAIQKAIVATFDKSDWKELAYRTGTEEEITGHYRLLRSLEWSDEDYAGNVLWGIETILEGDKDGLDEILRTPSVAEWLKKNEPCIYATYVPSAKKIAVPSPSPQVTSATVERAISDAETLLRTSGATSAVDRIHTALHGYLLVLCDDEGIAYPPDAGVTDLFKLLRQQHPKLQAIGPRGQEILQIVRSFSGGS